MAGLQDIEFAMISQRAWKAGPPKTGTPGMLMTRACDGRPPDQHVTILIAYVRACFRQSGMIGGGVSRIVYYIESGYEQHCLGTPNSGRSYARRAHASRS